MSRFSFRTFVVQKLFLSLNWVRNRHTESFHVFVVSWMQPDFTSHAGVSILAMISPLTMMQRRHGTASIFLLSKLAFALQTIPDEDTEKVSLSTALKPPLSALGRPVFCSSLRLTSVVTTEPHLRSSGRLLPWQTQDTQARRFPC